MYKYLFSILFITIFSFGIASGVTLVDFDIPSSFKSIDIYDSWEDSPFRNGELKGHWGLVNDSEIAPVSGAVLAAQRSRYGSNLFGSRIDLATPFNLKPETQYVKLKLLRPTNGRVALMGLGSRQERLSQNPFTEQFYQESLNSLPPGEWAEAIFPIKGADGVIIRALVIMPDCESPHNLTEDFIYYVSDIELLPSIENNSR